MKKMSQCCTGRRGFALLAAVWVLGVGPACSAPTPGSSDQKAFDAHATAFRYFFEDADMDFHFGTLILGAAGNGGLEPGEAFYAASQITNGDAESWQKEWSALGERLAARGERSLAAGHAVSARHQFLRASYAYRISLISTLPDNPRLREHAQRSRALLKQGGALLNPPLEYIEIPFEGTVLPGYFRKGAPGPEPIKTLLMVGGGETFAEDLFFYIAPQAFDRGYNFLTVDLPGQGLLPLEGKVFRPDMHVPLKAVVDYVLRRSDVDPQRFAAYGYSGGGGFVPQAAMHDPRIRAIAMNSAVVDAYPLFLAMPVTQTSAEEMGSWTSFHGNVVKVINWRWGAPMDQPAALAEANRGFSFDPSKIDVPALIIVGEGEYRSKEVQRQQKIALDNFPNPQKKMVVTPADEGATNHCIMENRALVGQVLFDWLDEIFASHP